MSEMNGLVLRKRNPGLLQPDDVIREQFVVREHELAIVLEVLRGNVDADSCQHTLIVAPRGRGKTMLLARVAAELHTNREFSSRLLPVRFMEESDEILSAADFWLEVLFYLANAIDKQNPEVARNLRATRDDLSSRWRERELDERARVAVLETADALGVRLVLMVENLQALCANVDDAFGWKLRKTLQTEPQIILVATATSRFEALDDAQEPFFELFRIISLGPLDAAQCGRLWKVVSGDAADERQQRALEILTGGSPRYVVILSGFTRHRSMRRLMEELVQLIDDLTDTFRGYQEALPKTERRVFLSIADLWQPSTTGEIAVRARMDVRTVSTMLGRLVQRGSVISEGSGRKRLYGVAERLYCIYYKMRRERDEAAIVQGLLHFMTGYFTAPEFSTIFDKLLLEAAQSRTILEGIERARALVPLVDRMLSSGRWLTSGQPVAGKSRRHVKTTDARRLSEAIPALLEAAAEHERMGEHASAVSTYDHIVNRCGSHPTTELQVAVARALVNKGLGQERLGERTPAIATYDQVVRRFGASDLAALQVQVAGALINKGVAQERDGQHAAAIATCEAVDARYGLSDHPELQEQVAWALVNKTVALEQLGDCTAVIATCDELVARFRTNAAIQIQEQVARALVNKGFAQEHLGLNSAATATYNDVIGRYGTKDVPELSVHVAAALNRKGAMRANAGEYEAAIAICDEIVKRNGASDLLQLQEQVGRAMVNKGTMQVQLGEHSAAIATYEQVARQFGADKNHELRVLTAKCLINKGSVHGELGDHAAEVDTYRTLINQYGSSGAPELQAIVAEALISTAIILGRAGNHAASISAYDEAVTRYGPSHVPELQYHVADALERKGALLGGLGRHPEAIAAIEDLLEHYGNSNDPKLQEIVAQAMNMKGASHALLDDPKATIETSDTIIERFGASREPKIQVQVAMALFHEGMAQLMTGRVEEAVTTSEELDRRSSAAADDSGYSFRWKARHLRVFSLVAQGDSTSSVDAFCSLYAEFLPDKETMIPELVDTVAMLVTAGVPEREIIAILRSDPQKTAVVAPLIIALRQRDGETVRAPAEVLEVAADVRMRIDNTRRRGPLSTPPERPVVQA